ncbi:MAG: F0F1 ATP synthase subunit B [Patescibacteria group bacterium]
MEPTGGIGALGLDLKIFIAQLVNFTIVLLVLWRWAYKPIVRMLDERQKKIEQSVKDASEIESRLQRVELERVEVLKVAREQAKQSVGEALAGAEIRRQEVLEKTKVEVERVIAHGKQQLNQEREMMMRDARKELAEIIVVASQKIIVSELNEKKATSLAEEVIRKMV